MAVVLDKRKLLDYVRQQSVEKLVTAIIQMNCTITWCADHLRTCCIKMILSLSPLQKEEIKIGPSG